MYSDMKLGKLDARRDDRNLKLTTYLPVLPPPMRTVDYTNGIKDWGMMKNNELGDCTIAASGHAIQVWTTNTSKLMTVPDADIEKYYTRWAGYVPGDPDTDRGAVELDVLNHWRKEGLDGHFLKAFVSVDPDDALHVRQALSLFGGLYAGVALPKTCAKQRVWDVVGIGTPDAEPGSWGGHAIFMVGYDTTGLYCITWGGVLRMTWRFWLTYVDECYALLSNDWLGAFYSDPQGFNLKALEADLKAVSR